MSKNFEDLKLEFSSVTTSNEKISNHLKTSLVLKDDFNKTKKENELLSIEILELKSSISKFHKGKERLDNLLDS